VLSSKSARRAGAGGRFELHCAQLTQRPLLNDSGGPGIALGMRDISVADPLEDGEIFLFSHTPVVSDKP